MLRAQNLSVTLSNRTIIDNLSFTVARGEVLTIVGPNGAGKTVLLKALLNLLPYKGTVVKEPPEGPTTNEILNGRYDHG